MDNFTHSLAGWALGQTGLKNKSRKGLAALILGANMPDIDVFFGHSCWAPLATHRGFTHGLVGGVLLLPPLLAALLWLYDRWQVRRGVRFKSGLPMHFGWLLGLCFLGAVTHPLLDLQTSYAVQLFSPFSNGWYHEESLFIIDVWLWTGMAFAIWLSRRWEGKGKNWTRPPIIALVCAVAYIGLNSLVTAQARNALRIGLPHLVPETIFAQLEPVIFWNRGLVYRANGQIGYGRYSPFTGLVLYGPTRADNMRDPLVRRAIFATPELVRFMRWSVMPMATVDVAQCKARVTFTDARFAEPRIMKLPIRNPFLHHVTVPLNKAGCRAINP